MRAWLRGGRTLFLVVLLLGVSLASTFAQSGDGEPVPGLQNEGMQRLVAPDDGGLESPTPSSTADLAAVTGSYPLVFAAEIHQGAASTNYATANSFKVGQYSGVRRAVLLADLSALPPDVTIDSATLQVYHVESYDYPATSRTLTAYRISSWWTEHRVTWNNAPSCAEAYGSVSIGHGSWGWYAMDVTALVRAWLNGAYPNYGIMLRGSENEAYRAFSSDGTTTSPKLVIQYSLPQQAMEAAPASLYFTVGDTWDVPARTVRTDALSFELSSTTVDVLGWSAAKVGGATWLDLDATSGAFSAVEPATIQASVITDTLAKGHVYHETIRLTSSPAVQGSPLAVDVTLWYSDGLRTVFLPTLAENAVAPHDYDAVGVFIGIADYIYLPASTAADSREPPKSSDLSLSNDDAFALGDLSISGEKFHSNNVRRLTEWLATKLSIRRLFDWLKQWLRPDTLLLITFSGHGGYGQDVAPLDESDGYDEFIVAAESDGTSDMAGVIYDDELADWLDELASERIVLIIDSCFAGGLIACETPSDSLRVRTVAPLSCEPSVSPLGAGDGLVQDIGGSGRLIMTAASETQASWEFGALEGGVFSYYLVQALLDPNSDTNSDGWISFEEAFHYAESRVDDYVYLHTGHHQNPQMYDGISGDVPWARRP
ncbi:MAG: DNRLRE domain-containing protein [Chloroflexota bacterium]